jgi:hypothetical protein
VISTLEDAQDYKAFEEAIAADFDAQSAVERELVLRLAGLLWRLRRTTRIEAGLFDIQATRLENLKADHAAQRQIMHAIFCRTVVQSESSFPPERLTVSTGMRQGFGARSLKRSLHLTH